MSKMLRMSEEQYAARIKAKAIRYEPVLSDAVVKPKKYHNVATGRFASKKEARRAEHLRLLEKSGMIRDLVLQPRYLLIPKQEGERACFYVADASYEECGEDDIWRPVCEDTKSKATKTPAYVIKRKLMLMVHGIKIREI